MPDRARCAPFLAGGLCLLGAVSLPACVEEARSPGSTPAAPMFSEFTVDAPLAGVERIWPDGTYFLPEIMGPGVGLLDYDGDGDLDILQVRAPPPGQPESPAPNRLFQRQPDGSYREVAAGVADPGYGQGLAVGDMDNDGDADVYFANYGPDALYRNNGDGSFSDVTPSSGISGERWSSTATFCDYDRDGFLDLYVVHYLRIDYRGPCRTNQGIDDYCGPASYDGVADRLYRNRGAGRFEDVSAVAGLRRSDVGQRAKGLGAVCLDFTGDGWPDIFVANDGEANQLWVNRTDGTFADHALMLGVAVNRHGRAEASMGVTVGDVDRDGELDLFLTHLSLEHNTLYFGGGKLPFMDRTVESGMAERDLPYTGFGCGLFDIDHDGDLDLAVVNGQVRNVAAGTRDRGGSFWQRYAEGNLVFLNDGTGRFAWSGARAGELTGRNEVSRGLALGDLDEDGDLDVVVSNVDNVLRVYRNDAPPPYTHWLLIRVLAGPRDAIGARVTLILDDGSRLIAPVLRGYSYQSSNDPRAHFGLGRRERVERIEVDWPDGRRERFPAAGVDRVLELRQGGGAPA